MVTGRKSEIRKSELRNMARSGVAEPGEARFVFLSDFGFRISDLFLL
jgi:hypothetical protein